MQHQQMRVRRIFSANTPFCAFVIGRYKCGQITSNRCEHFPFLAAPTTSLLFIVMEHFSGLKIS
jgi:hypothetical protein